MRHRFYICFGFIAGQALIGLKDPSQQRNSNLRARYLSKNLNRTKSDSRNAPISLAATTFVFGPKSDLEAFPSRFGPFGPGWTGFGARSEATNEIDHLGSQNRPHYLIYVKTAPEPPQIATETVWQRFGCNLTALKIFVMMIQSIGCRADDFKYGRPHSQHFA